MFLSQVGQELLIKSVAKAISNNAMRVFLLLLDLYTELEMMMNSF